MACAHRLSTSLALLSFRARVVPRAPPSALYHASGLAAMSSKQMGLGAFLKKGVKMVEHIKVDIPTTAGADGEKKPPTRTSGRKRTMKAEADAKAAAEEEAALEALRGAAAEGLRLDAEPAAPPPP